MTEKNRLLAEKWIQSFIISRGYLEPQGLWLNANLTVEEKVITSVELLGDPDSRPILLNAYRNVKKYHNFTKESEEVVASEIRNQINLARSQMLFRELGHIND